MVIVDPIEQLETLITISDILEYQYCPRFTYFMHVLDIPQHEDTRKKVRKGREVHKMKSITNKKYLRKKLGVVGKEINLYLSSNKYRIKGILDEVLFLNDGSAAPFEYKYAEYKGRVFSTHKFQLIIQGLLIKEKLDLEVNKGFICYTRSNHLIRTVIIGEKDFNHGIAVIEDVIQIMKKGLFPKRTSYRQKCYDCCYRNLCS